MASAIVTYAYNQGSLQTVGARADQATQATQVEASQTADNARQAISNATEDNSQMQQPTQSN